MARLLNRVAASAYGVVSKARNFLYDAELIDALSVGCPVISVGNLTVGGTGKTPVVQWVLDQCLQKNKRCAVVGRNYKARKTGISRVDPSQAFAAYDYGDEPTMIAAKYPQVPVYVSSKKWQAAFYACSDYKPDVIIVDDGFQHRSLRRDLDLVLIDATSSHADYDILPAGKAREEWASLSRSSWIFLTKANFVDELKIEEWYRMFPTESRVLELSYRLKEDFLSDAGKRVIAFTGLAQPDSFKQSLVNDGLYDLKSFIKFSDHHQYTDKDMSGVIKEMHDHGAELILTTEKDWIKVMHLNIPKEIFRPLGLEVHAMGPVEEFHASLDQIFSRHP